MTATVTCQAPAKINLGLIIEGRRDDGYHDIATIFLKISLADILHVETTTGRIEIHCTHPDVPCDERNLIHQAVAMLQPLAPGRGARVYLDKHIPVAAGVGGGSSDAAAALLAVNALWGLQLAPDDLRRYGARLGADVPFFLYPSTAAYGRGRGDQLSPLICPNSFFLVLVTPPVAVSTAQVYGQYRIELTDAVKDITIVGQHFESGDLESLAAACVNDLETVVIQQFPIVKTVKETLRQPGTYGVCMSGSGPTVYALCPSQDVAERVAAGARSRGWPTWVCQPCSSDISVLDTAVSVRENDR
jgi:4-diphosphocytidyl-2-C-methyl-D-erythritol kinase